MDKDTITATKKWFVENDKFYGKKWVVTPACPDECIDECEEHGFECEGHGFTWSRCPICDGLAGDRYGIATFKIATDTIDYDDVCSNCYTLAAGVAEQDEFIMHGYNPEIVSAVFDIWDVGKRGFITRRSNVL